MAIIGKGLRRLFHKHNEIWSDIVACILLISALAFALCLATLLIPNMVYVHYMKKEADDEKRAKAEIAKGIYSGDEKS